jgi:ribosome-associated translation inhibitor RaiA
MRTVISALHCEIPAALRERAEAIGDRLGQLAPRGQDCIIVFDVEAADSRATAEVRLHIPRGKLLVAKGEGGDHRTALDRAEEKLRPQLERIYKASTRARAQGA